MGKCIILNRLAKSRKICFNFLFEKQTHISITKSSQIHKEKFNIHTGHIGGSSQSEWIGEYTVLEGGR